MTAPIEDAYTALQTALGAALVGAQFLKAPTDLEVDPSAAFAPVDDSDADNPEELRVAAALLQTDTKPIRTLMGGPAARYVVEREVRLEMVAYGSNKGRWAAALEAALAAVAGLPGSDPTLGGTAERFMFVESVPEPLEPNGDQRFVTFAIRVRSGDPLGLTP